MAKDTVCGLDVDEKTAKYKSVHMGKTYYFCSQMCNETFDKNPMKYASPCGQSGHSMYLGHCC